LTKLPLLRDARQTSQTRWCGGWPGWSPPGSALSGRPRGKCTRTRTRTVPFSSLHPHPPNPACLKERGRLLVSSADPPAAPGVQARRLLRSGPCSCGAGCTLTPLLASRRAGFAPWRTPRVTKTASLAASWRLQGETHVSPARPGLQQKSLGLQRRANRLCAPIYLSPHSSHSARAHTAHTACNGCILATARRSRLSVVGGLQLMRVSRALDGTRKLVFKVRGRKRRQLSWKCGSQGYARRGLTAPRVPGPRQVVGGEADGGEVETVLIPVVRQQGLRDRLTICLSSQVRPPPCSTSAAALQPRPSRTGLAKRCREAAASPACSPGGRDARRRGHGPSPAQVGCAMNCQFCYTGRMGLLGNLSPAQIVEQVGPKLAWSRRPCPEPWAGHRTPWASAWLAQLSRASSPPLMT
jgi:hypothetical protein